MFFSIFCIGFVSKTLAADYSYSEGVVFDEYYSDQGQTQLQVELVDIRDHFPPKEFDLVSPSNNLITKITTPTFVWKETTDERAVRNYTFKLKMTKSLDGKQELDTITITLPSGGRTETDDYEAWLEDGQYNLHLKKSLRLGEYEWYVEASDRSNTIKSNSTWKLTVSTSAYCEAEKLMNEVTLVAPTAQVDSLKPAIIINFPAGKTMSRLDIKVDGVSVFTDVSLVPQTTNHYSVSVGETRITFQPVANYLPAKTTGRYRLEVTVTNNEGCIKEFVIDPLTASDSDYDAQALVATLVSPSNDLVSTEGINTFVWTVCAPTRAIASQEFYLDGKSLFTLGAESVSTSDYTLKLTDLGAGECGPYRTQMTLTLLNPKIISYNDPLNANDWHRWRVSVTNHGQLTGMSSVARFRYLPGTLGNYHWCTSQNQCTTGTLTQCLESGRNCYLADMATCQAHAHEDCSDHPPVHSYYWCTNQFQCAQGTLAQCYTTGKNCYQIHDDPAGGHGCLQAAATECASQATYHWCQNSAECQEGSFDECVAAKKRCYLHTEGFVCNEDILRDCREQAWESEHPLGVLTQDFFGSMPVPSLLDVLSDLGIDSRIIAYMRALSADVLPYFSTLALLPLGLLVIFFPRPRGRVIDSQSHQGLPDALVVVQQEGHFVSACVSNKNGYFTGFKLPPGDYTISVSTITHVFPAALDQEGHKPIKSGYYGEHFRISSEWVSTFTPLIPLDFDPKISRDRQRQWRQLDQASPDWLNRLGVFLNRFLNWLGWLWTITFMLMRVFTLIYPIWLNIIILGVYVIGLVRRLWATRRHFNLKGEIFDSLGQPLADWPLELIQVAYKRPAGVTRTDSRGRFAFCINPARQYLLQSPGSHFVEANGDKKFIRVDLGSDRVVELQLVAMGTT